MSHRQLSQRNARAGSFLRVTISSVHDPGVAGLICLMPTQASTGLKAPVGLGSRHG
jgi:hypothetical protein